MKETKSEQELQREATKKLIIEFATDEELEKINNMAKKMIKSLDIEELAGIVACKVEQTLVYIEKTIEEFDEKNK